MNERFERDAAVALAAYKRGVPSILPEDNLAKHLVEAHRWGRHGVGGTDGPQSRCPVCQEAKA